MNIYYIGGSPCSGKSTIAEILEKKYDFYYFKVDDYIDKYIKMGAEKGYEICKKQSCMNSEEIWMRDPLLQCEEELDFYKEIFEFILEDLNMINAEGIITEGAAYLPYLMKKYGVASNRYLAIIPSKDFQINHYTKREWVSYVLQGCSDKERAFSNWMNRDILFAQSIHQQCNDLEFASIVNDGSLEINELVEIVESYFELK